MNIESPGLTFSLALASGILAQIAARHLRVPSVVLLLVAGVLLGPDVANLVRPETLGAGLRVIVGAAVALILFEGGLQLEVSRLRGEAPTIRRLITLGALVTAIGGTLAARLIMAWPWAVAIPFGTLVTVTGPTVITPLLRRMRLKRNLHTILEAEAVLIDPIGAILAVVALEVVLAQELGSAARGLLGIPTRLILGTVVGAAGGWGLAKALESRRLVPHGLESMFTLALVLALYALCEAILPESGIMAAPIAGIVVGNSGGHVTRELREFKEQLAVLLVGMLFVLLAADVRVHEVIALGIPGALCVAALMVLVRPLNVWVSTRGSALSPKERAFLAWLGPRGIVAAAVASLFAEELVRAGLDEGTELRALVFLVIGATVLIQGFGGGLVAALLGVRRASDVGYLILGANGVARALGESLQSSGEQTVLVDTDPEAVVEAKAVGLHAIAGNALDDDVLERAELDGRRGLVALIPNEAVGLMVAEKARREFRIGRLDLTIRPGRLSLVGDRLEGLRAGVLFGVETDLQRWIADLGSRRAEPRRFRYVGEGERSGAGIDRAADVVYLTVEHRGRAAPIDDQTRLRRGDIVTVLTTRPLSPPAGFEAIQESAASLEEGPTHSMSSDGPP